MVGAQSHTPIFDKFSELGYYLFINSSDIYQQFSADGIFRRAFVSIPKESCPNESLLEKWTFFQAALVCGLAPLIGEYTRGYKMNQDGRTKEHHLKHPREVHAWVDYCFSTIAKKCDRIFEDLYTTEISMVRDELRTHLNNLKGLRTVVLALWDRLKDYEEENRSNNEDVLHESTELIHDGELILRRKLHDIEAFIYQVQVSLWISSKSLIFSLSHLNQIMEKRNVSKQQASLNFRDKWQLAMETSSELLIEQVLAAAKLNDYISFPIEDPSLITTMLKIPFNEEEDSQSVFSLHLSVLLYLILDMNFAQELQNGAEDEDILASSLDIVTSFSENHCLDLPMRDAIYVIWMIDSNLQGATDRALQLISGTVIASQLEEPLRQSMIMTVQIQEDHFAAWRFLHVLASPEEKQSTWNIQHATIAVTIYLDCNMWEEALFLHRYLDSSCTLEEKKNLIKMCIMTFERKQELATLLKQPMSELEESVLVDYLTTPKDTVVSKTSLQRIDILIGYYLQRNLLEEAHVLHANNKTVLRQHGALHLAAEQSMALREAFLDTYKNRMLPMRKKLLEQKIEVLGNERCFPRLFEHQNREVVHGRISKSSDDMDIVDESHSAKKSTPITKGKALVPFESYTWSNSSKDRIAMSPATSTPQAYSPGIFSGNSPGILCIGDKVNSNTHYNKNMTSTPDNSDLLRTLDFSDAMETTPYKETTTNSSSTTKKNTPSMGDSSSFSKMSTEPQLDTPFSSNTTTPKMGISSSASASSASKTKTSPFMRHSFMGEHKSPNKTPTTYSSKTTPSSLPPMGRATRLRTPPSVPIYRSHPATTRQSVQEESIQSPTTMISSPQPTRHIEEINMTPPPQEPISSSDEMETKKRYEEEMDDQEADDENEQGNSKPFSFMDGGVHDSQSLHTPQRNRPIDSTNGSDIYRTPSGSRKASTTPKDPPSTLRRNPRRSARKKY